MDNRVFRNNAQTLNSHSSVVINSTNMSIHKRLKRLVSFKTIKEPANISNKYIIQAGGQQQKKKKIVTFYYLISKYAWNSV